jgi:hypothetical protein
VRRMPAAGTMHHRPGRPVHDHPPARGPAARCALLAPEPEPTISRRPTPPGQPSSGSSPGPPPATAAGSGSATSAPPRTMPGCTPGAPRSACARRSDMG